MFRRNKQKPGAVTNNADVSFEVSEDYGTYIQSIHAIVEARRRYDEQRDVLAECDKFVMQSKRLFEK